MKFKFKIQQYQTDAVDAVVRVFEGQPYQDHVSYRRDIGQAQAQQMSFSVGENRAFRRSASQNNTENSVAEQY